MQKMSEKEMTIQQAINVMEKYTDITLSKTVIQAHNMAIQALEEIQQYRAIGLGNPAEVEQDLLSYKADRLLLNEYTAIGTLEECREAVERMKPKKLDIEARSVGEYLCGNCYEPIPRWDTRYCPNCGHAIDRSE